MKKYSHRLVLALFLCVLAISTAPLHRTMAQANDDVENEGDVQATPGDSATPPTTPTNVSRSSEPPTTPTNVDKTSAPPTTPTNVGKSPYPPTTPTNVSGSQSFGLQNPLDKRFSSVGGIIEGFLEIFTYLVIIGAVLALIWVGFQFVLARGNVERMKELKNWLLAIMIGVALVISARVIVELVINTLDSTKTVNPNIINSAKSALQ